MKENQAPDPKSKFYKIQLSFYIKLFYRHKREVNIKVDILKTNNKL